MSANFEPLLIAAAAARAARVEREGSFAGPEGNDALTVPAAVALGDGLALVGDAQGRRWIGFAPDKGWARVLELDAGSLVAAVRDGQGGALLAGQLGDGSDERPWFGALDARAKLSTSVELGDDAPGEFVAVLAGDSSDERALLLGRGSALSLDRRSRVRWRADAAAMSIRAGARLSSGELLVVGDRAAWARLAGSNSDDPLAQGEIEIAGADPLRTLDAIVALDHDMGFIALGRAKREPEQAHDQVIAVGFDRTGQPTWTRVLEHLRAVEIYGGTVRRGMPGAAHFLARIPVGGEPPSALAWIEISPGVDGVLSAPALHHELGVSPSSALTVVSHAGRLGELDSSSRWRPSAPHQTTPSLRSTFTVRCLASTIFSGQRRLLLPVRSSHTDHGDHVLE